MSPVDLPQVQSLSNLEKLELVDEIWKSVSTDFASLEATQEEKDTLDARWSQFLQNPSPALTISLFEQELVALRT
jgi:putative addiction module component (TIGR02574 family)